MSDRRLEILRTLLTQPTAPFHEEAVIAAVADWAARCGVGLTRDRGGNVFLSWRNGSPAARWFFTAHMDHPGFRLVRREGLQAWAEFRGSVAAEYFPGAGVKFLAPAGAAAGVIVEARKDDSTPFLLCRVELNRPSDVPAGAMGLWDVPAFRARGSRIAARGCDDVAGVAAVLCAMEELAASGAAADVTGLLTRGEEAGFVGALDVCASGGIPRDAMIVSIETSLRQPSARLGDGVVVRVGDRTRTFHPALTAHLAAVAGELAGRDANFRFTRQLMPGGTCESTAFCAWGYTAAAVCIPLENYHNQGPGHRIAPERIDRRDFDCLVKLLVAVAADGRLPADTENALKNRLEGLLAERGKYLHESSESSRLGESRL